MAQIDRIRDALRHRPFEPFLIRMADGTTCLVEGPEWLAIPPVLRVREIAFFALPGRGRSDEFQTHWLNVSLITDVVVPGLADMPRAPAEPAEDEG